LKLISFDAFSYTPAGHEDPRSPGVVKKVLLERGMLQDGHIQMVNWASLGVGKKFAPHYHETMQEFFILVQGTAQMAVGAETATMRRGDLVVIDPGEIHQMRNAGSEDVEYLAIGITGESDGKTIVVKQQLLD